MRSALETLERYADKRDARDASFVAVTVRPALQKLLDKLQRRMGRHRIRFRDGMGVTNFTIDHDSHDGLTEASQGYKNRRATRLRERFPELVEIMEVAYAADTRLHCDIGSLDPSQTN